MEIVEQVPSIEKKRWPCGKVSLNSRAGPKRSHHPCRILNVLCIFPIQAAIVGHVAHVAQFHRRLLLLDIFDRPGITQVQDMDIVADLSDALHPPLALFESRRVPG
jgi:hypothetical protein